MKNTDSMFLFSWYFIILLYNANVSKQTKVTIIKSYFLKYKYETRSKRVDKVPTIL